MIKEIKFFLFASTVLGFLQTETLAMQEFENEGITRKTKILFEKIEELTRTIEKSKIPTGTIASFAGSKEPEGWLICDGRAVCSSKYPDLFNVIGKTYTSTVIISPKKESEQILGGDIFCIPDLRGRVVVGVDSDNRKHFVTSNRVTSDNKLGESGGEENVTLTIDQMPHHSHGMYAYEASNKTIDFGFEMFNKGGQWGYTQYAGGSQPHNNMQPYLILNYIIKY